MKKLIVILLTCLSVALYGQVERMPNLTGTFNASQTMGDATTWTLTGPFSDASGIYDASGVQVGDIVFFSDGTYTFFLPITEIVSAMHPTLSVKVSKVGITQISSVPSGQKAIFHPTNKGYFPFVSGISNADQQSYNEYLMYLLDNASAGSNCERSFAQVAHEFSPWTPVYWDGSEYRVANHDTIVPDYIVVDSIDADNFTVATCGTYPTTLADGTYWYTSASPGYSLVQGTTKVALFQVIDGVLVLKPIVGFNLGEVSAVDNGIISELPLRDVTIVGATSSDLRIQNTRIQFDGKFKVGADSSFTHDPVQDTTHQKGTAVFGKASLLGPYATSGIPFIFRNSNAASTYMLIESGRDLLVGGEATLNLKSSGGWSEGIQFYNDLSFYSYKNSRVNLKIGSNGAFAAGKRTIIVGRIDDPSQWGLSAGLVLYDTITVGKALFVVKKVASSSTPIATFSSGANDRLIIEDDGDIEINKSYFLPKTAPSATAGKRSALYWDGTGSTTTPVFKPGLVYGDGPFSPNPTTGLHTVTLPFSMSGSFYMVLITLVDNNGVGENVTYQITNQTASSFTLRFFVANTGLPPTGSVSYNIYYKLEEF